MFRRLAVLAIGLASLAAQAQEGAELSLRSKSLAAAASAPVKSLEAPFRHARHVLPELLLHEPPKAAAPQGACERRASALCYDAADGRVVYRPARRYMPEFEGMRAESVSLRRHRLVFKYSFR